MSLLDFLTIYCKSMECGKCEINTYTSYGCPWSAAPKFWDEEAKRKAIKLFLKKGEGNERKIKSSRKRKETFT